MAKLILIALFAALSVSAYAASYGGVKDLAGNYYDFSTGQYSSALTGKVYNTAPVVHAPISYAAPHLVHAAPYYYGAPYPYAAASYVSPYLIK